MLGLSELIKLNYKKHTTNVVIGKTPDTYSFLNSINNCTNSKDIENGLLVKFKDGREIELIHETILVAWGERRKQ